MNSPGFGGSLLASCTSGSTILEWSNKGSWNPIGKKAHFVGQGHVSCAKHIVYDETSDQWSTAANPSGIGSFGHGYEHNTVNPATGDIYYRNYSSDRIEKFSAGTGGWSSVPNVGTSVQVAGAVEYFPDAGGMLFVDGDFGVYFLNTQSGQWTLVANTTIVHDSSLPTLSMGSLHNFASYNPQDQAVYFGGGDGSRSFYKIDRQLRITSAANSPVTIGIHSAMTVPDPASGAQLVFGNNGQLYSYNSANDSWSNQGGHEVMNNALDWRIAIPITSHGVIMFLAWNFDNSKVLLYRHASGSGIPVAVRPVAPIGLSAN